MSRTFLAPVPVAPVLFALDRAPDARGRYWCPFHNDERPGGKPSAEVRDDLTVLSCWSCGATATAPMLVAKITGCSLQEGLKLARGWGGELEIVAKKPREGPSAERLESELMRQTTHIRYPRDVDPVEVLCKSKGWSDEITRYARESWNWIGDYRGRVVFPHRAADGSLTGLKWRLPPDWEKDGRPGSQFRQLYGMWRVYPQDGSRGSLGGLDGDLADRKNLEVWVTEGESDTVWAAYHLEPLGVQVFGLSGAGQRPREDELEIFRDKLVVLVFDDDDAGNRARRRWADALRAVSKRTVNLRLDDGQDLCSTADSPVELRKLIDDVP